MGMDSTSVAVLMLFADKVTEEKSLHKSTRAHMNIFAEKNKPDETLPQSLLQAYLHG